MAQAQAHAVQDLVDESKKDAPAAAKAKKIAESFKTKSGYEGRELELGQALNVILRTLSVTVPYPHEINDALVKAHLNAIQFAYDNDMLDKYVEHDRKTMLPINERVKKIIENTGNPEIALIALFDRTACHYQLALDSHGEGRSRSWTDPFRNVLPPATKLGQFTINSEIVHNQWMRPRILNYGVDMGVPLEVSDLGADGQITVTIAD